MSGAAGTEMADPGPADDPPDLRGTAPPDEIDTPQERGEERLEYEALELKDGIDCDGENDDQGGTTRLSLEIANCINSWTCDDGTTYGFICIDEGCVCQVNGVRSGNVARTMDSERDCNADLELVNARCLFWVE